MTRQRLFDILTFAVGIALIALLFTRLEDPPPLWAQFAGANMWLILLGAICYSGAVALSGIKWGVLLRAVGIQVPLGRLMSYQWQAEFFNNFLPAQVGGDVAGGPTDVGVVSNVVTCPTFSSATMEGTESESSSTPPAPWTTQAHSVPSSRSK